MNRNIALAFFFWFFLLPVLHLYSDYSNSHFKLSVIRRKNPDAVYVTVAPKRDKKIKGLSEEKPFITIESSDAVFENQGILIRTEYITAPEQDTFAFPFHPVDPDRNLTHLNVHLTITYVPCLISTGTCMFPETIEQDYSLKVSGWAVSTDIINTGILAAFFLLAAIGLIFYIRIKKNILFTSFFIVIFTGMLFYTFVRADEKGISQADISRDIAGTLCLSCIGIESTRTTEPVNRLKTKVYAGLEEPVLITVFSAPWCGTCPFAKAYVKELCSIYPETLSYEVADISESAGKEKYAHYKTQYLFKEPLPLPAIIVSVNMVDVLYGTKDLEENLIMLITGDADEQD
jgi:thiol-disulfide isomerase/thioredoxin